MTGAAFGIRLMTPRQRAGDIEMVGSRKRKRIARRREASSMMF